MRTKPVIAPRGYTMLGGVGLSVIANDRPTSGQWARFAVRCVSQRSLYGMKRSALSNEQHVPTMVTTGNPVPVRPSALQRRP